MCVRVVCMGHLPHVNKVGVSALLYYISGTAQLITGPLYQFSWHRATLKSFLSSNSAPLLRILMCSHYYVPE